jgi:hypothetical protein
MEDNLARAIAFWALSDALSAQAKIAAGKGEIAKCRVANILSFAAFILFIVFQTRMIIGWMS